MITSWFALSGQVYLNSDWLPGLLAERLDIIKRTIPAHGSTARPVDYFDAIMPRVWLVTDTRRAVRRDVLGLYNWESKDQTLPIQLSHLRPHKRLIALGAKAHKCDNRIGRDQTISCSSVKAGLDPATTYFAFDFWTNAPAPSFAGEFKYQVPAQSCREIAVRAASGNPVLVSTSRHLTQGMVDVLGEKWSGLTRTLSSTSQLVGGDPYELCVAGLNNRDKIWMLLSATVSAADKAAGVTVDAKSAMVGEDGWARVGISSKESRAVNWSLKFTAERRP